MEGKVGLAGEPGFEPGLTDPESAVLPLDDSPVCLHINKLLRASLRRCGFAVGVGWRGQQIDGVLDTLHAALLAQDGHGVEEGRGSGAASDGDAEGAEQLARLDAEVGGEGTEEGFKRLCVPRRQGSPGWSLPR